MKPRRPVLWERCCFNEAPHRLNASKPLSNLTPTPEIIILILKNTNYKLVIILSAHAFVLLF